MLNISGNMQPRNLRLSAFENWYKYKYFLLNFEIFLSDFRGWRYLHPKKVYFFVGRYNHCKAIPPTHHIWVKYNESLQCCKHSWFYRALHWCNHQNDDVIYEWVLSELPCNLSTCKHSWNTLKDPYNTNNWGCRGSWSWSWSPAVGRWSRDPLFLGSIWTQIWTWLDSNPVFGFYGVEIFIKYAGILFTYYIIILGGWGVQSHEIKNF